MKLSDWLVLAGCGLVLAAGFWLILNALEPLG